MSLSDVENLLLSAACVNRRLWEKSCWDSLVIFWSACVEEGQKDTIAPSRTLNLQEGQKGQVHHELGGSQRQGPWSYPQLQKLMQ